MQTTQEIFTERIRELRQENGYSFKEMQKKFGKKEPTIRAWEAGRAMATPDTLVELAKEFNCSVDYLLGKDNTRSKSNLAELHDTTLRLVDALHGLGSDEPRVTESLLKVLGFVNSDKNTESMAHRDSIADLLDGLAKGIECSEKPIAADDDAVAVADVFYQLARQKRLTEYEVDSFFKTLIDVSKEHYYSQLKADDRFPSSTVTHLLNIIMGFPADINSKSPLF